MYITITAQKMGGNYSQSSADFVGYLEKENEGLEQRDMEHFFNQFGDEISAEEVVKEIDGNTAKLKKKEITKIVSLGSVLFSKTRKRYVY